MDAAVQRPRRIAKRFGSGMDAAPSLIPPGEFMQSGTRLGTFVKVWVPISLTGKGPSRTLSGSRLADTKPTTIRRIVDRLEQFSGCADWAKRPNRGLKPRFGTRFNPTRYLRGLTASARIRCPDCGYSSFRPFSCKVFHLCPSCDQKRTILYAENLAEDLLMFDEVQSGVGKTGTFLACEAWLQGGVKPDVVTLAKGLAGGLPVGAVLAGERTKAVLGVSDHGNTFCGFPLAAAADRAVLSVVNRPEFLAEIRRKGEVMASTIWGWNHPLVAEIRGRGLKLGENHDCDIVAVYEDEDLFGTSTAPPARATTRSASTSASPSRPRRANPTAATTSSEP